MIAYSELICSSLKPKLSRSVVIKVFDEMIKSGKKTVDEFETIYEQHLDMQNRSTPQDKIAWTFFIPFEITLNSDVVKPASIRVLGKDFTFLSKQK